ncbi:MAG: ATP-binding cassette domain-containing protein [Desulfurococcaceae archaeon]
MLLEVNELSVCADNRRILDSVSMSVNRAEVHVVMGPNGSGKSTLLSAIMGLRHVNICGGKLLLEGVDITKSPSYERAKLGIALAHQYSPEIKGVKLRDISSALAKKYGCSDCTLLAKSLLLEDFMSRDLFVNYSGGEKKRTELFLVMLQNPKLAMLDEPDSGVDIESIQLIARSIERLRSRGTGVVLVTHLGAIAEKLSRIDKVHILMQGKLIYSGSPDEVLPVIVKFGYRRGLEVLRERGT